jgi:catechol 2,3-dioxygenase-like lactoylglutathione lyase family enzyme
LTVPPPTPDPAVNVTNVNYVGFETPDIDRLVEYYTKVLAFKLVDRSQERAYLTTGFEHHCVVLTRSDVARGRTTLGFEIAEPLADAQRRLRAAGHDAERRTDIGPGTPDVLVVEEPTTGTPLHLLPGQEPSGTRPSWLSPTKLSHVAGYTPDLGTLDRFYREVLGFKWSDGVSDFFVFVRCNADHHSANFMESTKLKGLHHVAFECRDPGHVISMVDHLSAQGYRLDWGPGRHGPGHNFFTYHKDPDGNVVELSAQLDRMDETRGYWEPRPWHETFPMYPKIWDPADPDAANVWGPGHLGRDSSGELTSPLRER